MVKALSLVFTLTVALEMANTLRNKQVTSNVTQTLDFLLAGDRYDKRLRPGFGGPPITVSVNLFIKSMGPVSENDQSYGLDCYFRQQWHDLRLKYQKLPGLEELSMSWLFLDRVWKPDTYFFNGKKSFLHRITVPNKFLRLRHDGFITYSMRLTLTAGCFMYLRKFPLDAQRCPLVLGSYGYSNKDIIYEWAKEAAIGLQEGVEIAQFDLVNVTIEPEKTVLKGEVAYSAIQVDFWLRRHKGYFMLQVYVPCCLIVVCSWISFWIDPDAVYVPCGLNVLSSWVSFWIDPDDVAARVALGVTTVLSLTTMGFGGRAQMPKVSYWTAMDWFVIICFTSVFSVVIEYAIVNFVDKLRKDLGKERNASIAKAGTKAKARIVEFKDSTQARKRYFHSMALKQSNRFMSFSLSLPLLPDEIIDLNLYKIYPDDKCRIEHCGARSRSKSLPNLFSQECRLESDELSEFPMQSADEELIDLNEESSEMIVDVEESQEHTPLEGELNMPKRTFFKYLKSNSISDTLMKNLRQCLERIDLGADTLEDVDDNRDKFSTIDVQSRKTFPIAFLMSLIIYALAFTYYLTDDLPLGNSDRRHFS